MATVIGIKYVGKKNRPQRDTVAGTQLVWLDQEQVHYVPEGIAPRFLSFPDVWAAAGRKQGEVKDADIGRVSAVKEQEQPEPPPLVPLETLDREALIVYAQSHFGQKLAGNMSEANMRVRIRNWMNSPSMGG